MSWICTHNKQANANVYKCHTCVHACIISKELQKLTNVKHFKINKWEFPALCALWFWTIKSKRRMHSNNLFSWTWYTLDQVQGSPEGIVTWRTCPTAYNCTSVTIKSALPLSLKSSFDWEKEVHGILDYWWFWCYPGTTRKWTAAELNPFLGQPWTTPTMITLHIGHTLCREGEMFIPVAVHWTMGSK